MRMWADEKRLGTCEVLATTPVSSEALVVGKFLAAFALLVLGLVLTTSLPAVAASYGDLDMGPVLGGYLGAALLGAAFLALGLVCSSLVQDQFVALILGWVLGAATMFHGMPFWEGLVGRGAADALRRFGFGTRYESIARGLVDFRDVLFYVTVVSFLLVLNTTLVRARRFTA
jgi:ABC-2 type transport system permease protein